MIEPGDFLYDRVFQKFDRSYSPEQRAEFREGSASNWIEVFDNFDQHQQDIIMTLCGLTDAEFEEVKKNRHTLGNHEMIGEIHVAAKIRKEIKNKKI